MTGLVVGLLAGAGVFLIWWASWVPEAAPARRPSALASRLGDLLVQADLPSLSIRALVLVCGGVGATAFLGVLALSGVRVIAVCFAVMATWAPMSVVVGRARRRRQTWRTLWPEVVDNVSSGVRAGLSLPEALAQLADRGPEPLRPAFAAFAQDYRVTGSFGVCLDDLKDRLADPVADRLCEALRITREVGGTDLGRLLRSLSAHLRDDARIRSELEARQSWTVSAARLAVAAPWIVLALLVTRPEAADAFDRPAGALILLIGAVVSVLAYRLMLAIGRLPQERRVFR
jgi:tight adherence protein B